MPRYNRLVTLSLAAMIGLSMPAFAEDKPDPLVAKVGDLEIHQSDLDVAIANLDPQMAQLPDEQKRVAALSGAIDVKLFSKDAIAEKLNEDANYKARMKYLEERELHGAYFKKHVVDTVTPEEIKARYDKEVAALPKQEEVHARHILVKTEDEAKKVIAELDAGKDFAELAKLHSTDPNKADGGDLGYFGKGRMVKEFEAAAFALDKGAYTKTPVKTDFGWHVIKVEDKRIAPPPAFEQVQPQIRNMVMRDKYLELLAKARDAQGVEIVDETLRKGYEEANKKQ